MRYLYFIILFIDNMSIKSLLINQIFEKIIIELQHEDNKKKIDTYIVQPSLCYLFEKIYPYLLVTFIIFFLLFLITLIMLIIIIRSLTR